MPDTPRRVQRSRIKGNRLPDNTICVTRPGPFGNRYWIDQHTRGGHWFVHGPDIATMDIQGTDKEGARAEAVRLFRKWATHPGQANYRKRVRAELRGKNVACWCAIGTPCHGDVLLEISNSKEADNA
jgi:hypothetical protein